MEIGSVSSSVVSSSVNSAANTLVRAQSAEQDQQTLQAQQARQARLAQNAQTASAVTGSESADRARLEAEKNNRPVVNTSGQITGQRINTTA